MPDSNSPGPSLTDAAPPASASGPVHRNSWIRRAAGWLNAIYVAAFTLLIVLLFWWGERNWLLSLLLFAPSYVLLVPLIILTPLCLVLRPRLVLWQALCAAVICFVYMEFSWTNRPSDRANTLKVVTFNTGHGDRQQFQAFVKDEAPDLIVLQDAGHRGATYARLWADRYVAGRGEFLLVSRYPVRTADFVERPSWYGTPIAARFEVLCEGAPLIVYNVHLPTPRSQLSRFLSPRVLSELSVDEEHRKTFASYREYVEARIELAQQLAGVFASEKQRFIVCGDFNTPDHGYIHRILSQDLMDAHATAGRGWGLTFPGGTKGRAARHGPWLRIDYAYAGRGWEPIFCQTDPGRRSQHRAVAAHFVPVP